MMEKSSLGSGLLCSDQAYERGMHVNNPVESILTGKITGTTTFTVHGAQSYSGVVQIEGTSRDCHWNSCWGSLF